VATLTVILQVAAALTTYPPGPEGTPTRVPGPSSRERGTAEIGIQIPYDMIFDRSAPDVLRCRARPAAGQVML
jgi:hypothetical protein